VAAAVQSNQPIIPSSASVARTATMKNALNLGRVNLIGVYGSSSSRRALVRMGNGRYVKVSVGDRLDGGQVVAISDTRLVYQKGGRQFALDVLPLG
jgi:type IV pilus biogenesis protein PilP